MVFGAFSLWPERKSLVQIAGENHSSQDRVIITANPPLAGLTLAGHASLRAAIGRGRFIRRARELDFTIREIG